MNRRKILIGAGIGVVILIFAAIAIKQGRRGGVEVRTEEIERRDLVAVVTASGSIRPHRSVDIQNKDHRGQAVKREDIGQ